LSNNLAVNETEISNLITAREGTSTLQLWEVKTLVRHDLTAGQLVNYIARVRKEVPSIPVTTADAYNTLLANPLVIAASDLIFANYYPYWAGVSFDIGTSALHH